MKTQYTQDQLAKIQIEKELTMKTSGVERFNLNNERAIAEGSASETQWNKRIMQELVQPMSEAIEAYLDYYTGRPGKPFKTVTYLRYLTTTQAAYITIKNVLDSLTRETETLSIAKTIGSRIEDQVRFASVQKAAPRYIAKVQKAMAQSNSKQYKHRQAAMAGAARSLAAGDESKDIAAKPELEWEAWLEQDLVQLGSQLITIFADNVLFEGHPVVYKKVLVNGKTNKTWLAPTEHVEGWINEYKDAMESMAPTFAPCVIPPRNWTSPTVGGFHIPEISQTLPLIKGRRSQVRRLTQKQMPEVYEAVNTLQAVEWQISDDVWKVAQQVLASGLALGVPSREPLEFPDSPVDPAYEGVSGKQLKEMMTTEEWDTFVSWKRDTTQLHTMENKRKSDFIKVSRVLAAATQYQPFEKIHFVYTLDFRGRVYCKSDSVSPQGDDFQKGMLRFANGKPLGKRGYHWLAVQGAGVYGNDKCTFEERVEFIESIEDDIRDIATDPMMFTNWAAADKPYQYLNWCFEWANLLDWIEDGNKAEDFVSHIPCAMDGSCSGIQHYSAILRDPIGGAAVNLVPSDAPRDIYSDVAGVATNTFTDLQHTGEDEITREAAMKWPRIQGGVNRTLCKSPVMTLPYGSTNSRCRETTSEYLFNLQYKEDKKAKVLGHKPVKVHDFAKDNTEGGVTVYEAMILGTKVIWQSIGEVVVAAREGMKYIQDVAKVVAKSQHHLEWITPTGFIVEQREYDYTSKRVRTQLMGVTYVSLKQETTKYKVAKMKSSSAPNFIHSCDASHLVKAVNAIKARGLHSIAVIHDSFGSHACDTEVVRECLNNTFVDMYINNDVLTQYKEHNEAIICDEIDVDVPEPMGLDLELVRESTYLFG
jgi:DNA-directed RNA polymerase